MTKTHLKRLQKLLEHMEKGELSVDKFDFGTFRDSNSCGTAGCMGGELPGLFPRLWRWDEDTPLLKDAAENSSFNESARRFFGLTKEQVDYLFYPRGDFRSGGNSRLPGTASRRQVTANLRRFIRFVTPKP